MSIAVAGPTSDIALNSVSDEQIALLAHTFHHAVQPVWIEDAAGRCVYRNLSAQSQAIEGVMRFELTDHQGQLVGRVVTAEA